MGGEDIREGVSHTCGDNEDEEPRQDRIWGRVIVAIHFRQDECGAERPTS